MDFNGLRKDYCKTRQETFKFWSVVRLILETWRYFSFVLGYYLYNVNILASDIAPPPGHGTDLLKPAYRLCARYNGYRPQGRFVNAKCDSTAIGRYVYVFIPTSKYMTICEISVLGTCKFFLLNECIPVLKNIKLTRYMKIQRKAPSERAYFTIHLLIITNHYFNTTEIIQPSTKIVE